MKKGFVLKVASVFLSLCIVLVCFNMLGVSAAQYSGGSGTRNDPYLIKTADDLYNMRNNLSANFKLAATIDMKGYKTDSKYFNNGFVPIGDDSTKPFTGSFTCDMGSDGLPLYAILNLKIYNSKGEIFKHDWYSESDYPDALGQDEPYFWQTALFGTTNGANIYNIYVLNADIYSSVVGQHDGRYTDGGNKLMYGSMVDRMSTAVLIGEAINTSVSHCGVSGKVNGKTSLHGGFIGAVKDSNIENSYADVSVDTGGCWHVGGFVGFASGMTTIRNCFSLGSLNASMDGYGEMLKHGANPGSGCGGFIGTIDPAGVMIENCYSGVDLSAKTRGNNFLGASRDTSSVVKNCFCYGKVSGKTSAPSGKENTQNCYISIESKGLQTDFNAASASDITKYFTSIGGWQSGDKYPTLSTTNRVTDSGIYKAGEEREKAPNNQPQGSESQSSSSQTQNTSSSTSSQTQSSSQNAGSQSGTNSKAPHTTSSTPSQTTQSSSSGTQSQPSSQGSSSGAQGQQSTQNSGVGNTSNHQSASSNVDNAQSGTQQNNFVPEQNNNNAQDGSSQQENTGSEQVTLEEVSANTQEQLDVVQIILITIISVMIVGNCILTVAIALNALKLGKATDDESEGDEQDEE